MINFLRPWLGFSTLVMVAIAIAYAGHNTLPVDEHEVLVLRTTQEMHQRGDWVVPHFNDAPRLNKPPMNYWLTGVVATLSGHGQHIAPWHGRLISAMSGIGVALLIMVVGAQLYAPRAAWYGAGLFVTSAGYFTYAHDARPELLYSLFCFMGLSCFVASLNKKPTGKLPLVYMMWISYGLAILTKGPQIPMMFLLATVLFILFVQGQGVRALTSIQPFSGMTIMCILAASWWILLEHRLTADQFSTSQLAGSLLVPTFDNFLNGYYFYRPLQLILPWLPLAPIVAVATFYVDEERRETNIFLGLVIIVTTILFSVGSQQRYFYMLPILPIVCLLVGRGLEQLEQQRNAGIQTLIWLQVITIAVAVSWVYWEYERLPHLALWSVLALGLGGVVSRWTTIPLQGIGTALGILIITCLIEFADTDLFWSKDRGNKHILAQSIAETVPTGALLVTLDVAPEVYVYAADRTIPRKNQSQLELLIKRRQELYVIAYSKRIDTMPTDHGHEFELVLSMPKEAIDQTALYRLRYPLGDKI